jgi:hypothetical protein
MRYYVIEHHFELEASVQYGSEGLGGRAVAYLSMRLALERLQDKAAKKSPSHVSTEVGGRSSSRVSS